MKATEFNAVAEELEARTPFDPAHVRPALLRAVNSGVPLHRAREILLSAFESAKDFQRSMEKIEALLGEPFNSRSMKDADSG